MSRGRRRLGSISGGGLVPLLDTLFILLLSLLALSDVRSEEPVELVRIELPAVESGDDPGAPRAVVAIEIDRESRVFLTGTEREVTSWEQLDRALAEALGEGVPEEITVELRADRDARHGVAVELLQHLRLLGFANVHLLATGAQDPDAAFGGGAR